MESHIASEFEALLDCYYPVPTLNKLLKKCMIEKACEKTIWSKQTVYVHFMLGGNHPYIYRLAALTEMVILALDIMDDLQDKDNPDKIWMKEPQDQVLNAMVGLLMAVSAELESMRERHPELPWPSPGELSRLVSVAINGQHIDLTMDIETEERYVHMVQQKSCTLIRLAFYMGAGALPSSQLGEEKFNQINRLADFIGLMSQINNDVGDLLRLDVKNDLYSKKRTLPILYLLSDQQSDYPFLRHYYEGSLTFDELYKDWQGCLDYINNSGSIEYSKMIVQIQLGRAQELFAQIQAVSPWKERFQEIALDVFKE